MVNDAVQKMGHLMRRAGFGANMAEIQQRAGVGFDPTLRQLLDDAQKPDDGTTDWLLDYMSENNPQGRLRPQMLRLWWLYRMVSTDRPLQEKMVLFWHGHFATSASKVNQGELMLQQNRFFRDNALGNWRDILKGVSRDPAMILWLDNNTNYKAHANENYGRELMELFSLGIGNYSENDVKEGARAFTGWTVAGGNFSFNPRQHDTGVKTFLGRTGNFDGDDIIDIILEQPAASEFLTRKLFTFFAYENPEPEVVSSLAGTLRASNYDIRTLVEAIFRSNAFWSKRAINTQIKSPAQLVVGSLRMLDMGPMLSAQAGDPDDPKTRRRLRGVYSAAAQSLKQMGQDLFYPPNVKGWDGGTAWINSATMLERLNYASHLITLAGPRLGPGSVRELVADAVDASPEATVDAILSNLGPLQLPASTRTTIVKAMSGDGKMAVGATEGFQQVARLREAVTLAMQTPQYQVC